MQTVSASSAVYLAIPSLGTIYALPACLPLGFSPGRNFLPWRLGCTSAADWLEDHTKKQPQTHQKVHNILHRDAPCSGWSWTPLR